MVVIILLVNVLLSDANIFNMHIGEKSDLLTRMKENPILSIK